MTSIIISWTALVLEGEEMVPKPQKQVKEGPCITPWTRSRSTSHRYWFDSDNNEVPEGDARAVGDRQCGRPATSTSSRSNRSARGLQVQWVTEGRPHTEHAALPLHGTPLLAPPQSNNQTCLPYHFFLYPTTSQTNQKSGNYHKNTGKTTSLSAGPSW